MDIGEKIASARFLGREFLVWLWWQSEEREGVLPLPSGESCELWLEEQLTLVIDNLLERAESKMKGGTPSLTPEAKEALRQGKLPTRAKIRLDRGPQHWSFVLDADAFAISSVQIPALITEETEERFYERMQLVEELEAMIGGLLETFVRLRTSPAWERDALPAMRAWVAKDPFE
jgi:hypothetical protein